MANKSPQRGRRKGHELRPIKDRRTDARMAAKAVRAERRATKALYDALGGRRG